MVWFVRTNFPTRGRLGNANSSFLRQRWVRNEPPNVRRERHHFGRNALLPELAANAQPTPDPKTLAFAATATGTATTTVSLAAAAATTTADITATIAVAAVAAGPANPRVSDHAQ
jgi:hypothetical protein